MLGISVALFFLWCILRQVHFDDLKKSFAGTIPTWVMSAFFAFVFDYACRIERWRLMLKCDNAEIRWSTCAGPLLASFAANNVLPFRAGDVLRAFVFNRKLGTSSGVIIATLFVERLLDLLMVLVLLGASLAYFGLETNRFAGVGGVVLLSGAAVIMLVLLLPQVFTPLVIGLVGIISRIAPGFGKRLIDEINKSQTTLLHLAKGHTMPKLIVWSLLAWLAEGAVFWLAALALPALASPAAGWLALPVGTLATLIPSTPGYIGTFDYATVRAMTELGNVPAAATAYALLVHILLWLPLTVVGGMYFLIYPAKKHGG